MMFQVEAMRLHAEVMVFLVGVRVPEAGIMAVLVEVLTAHMEGWQLTSTAWCPRQRSK